jgi:cardiolipin synthase C
MRHVVALALSVLLVACARLPPRGDLADAFAPPPATHGVLAERAIAAQARHPGASGFHLVDTGAVAYAVRAWSAAQATASLDIQTYIWHADLTGRLLARHALRAADRGVHVRILVDDLDARAKNQGFAALDAHPSIEVRLYNAMASRRGLLGRAAEFGTGFKRLNHRMHNKSWIVDNRIALVGGRNLGDEYFDASDTTNFIDLDLLMIGPVVGETSANFDRFWNSSSNHPIAVLSPEAGTDAALQRLRVLLEQSAVDVRTSRFREVLREDPDVHALLAGEATFHWTDRWRFVSDDPMKARLDASERSAVLDSLLPVVDAAERDIDVVSPYFVPGRKGTDYLVAAARRGIGVDVLTNSLAATDVAAVHGGYARYRKDLLRGGVRLRELKPTGSARTPISLRGSSGSSLHTKALVVDDREVFVGSYNLDPRSTALNSEQGVLVDHAALAAQVLAIVARQSTDARAWRVTLDGNRLRWNDGQRTLDREPDAEASARFLAWLTRLLPLESQL